MSYSIDVNVLLHASNSWSPQQERARRFLVECGRRDEVLCIAWSTILSFVRISTNPRVQENALTPEEARANVEAILGMPTVRMIAEQDGFWEAYEHVCAGLRVRGNDVPDAHLAAILWQHGVRTLYTNDADFRRFVFLDVRNPFLDER